MNQSKETIGIGQLQVESNRYVYLLEMPCTNILKEN